MIQFNSIQAFIFSSKSEIFLNLVHTFANQKLECFVIYFKIINTFVKINIHVSYSKLYMELKNSIKIKEGQAVLELIDQNIF